MTKGEEKRLTASARRASAEELLDGYMNEVDTVAQMNAIESFAWGPARIAAEKMGATAAERSAVLRAELLRRLEGAS